MNLGGNTAVLGPWACQKALSASAQQPAATFVTGDGRATDRGPERGADAAACAEHAFFGYYFTYESEAAWHALYAAPAVQDLVGDHWEAVAGALIRKPRVAPSKCIPKQPREPAAGLGRQSESHGRRLERLVTKIVVRSYAMLQRLKSCMKRFIDWCR